MECIVFERDVMAETPMNEFYVRHETETGKQQANLLQRDIRAIWTTYELWTFSSATNCVIYSAETSNHPVEGLFD